MERLEPVLKQKFWILLGIGLIMTIVGWWIDTGTMAATIATRKNDIDAAEKKIPGGEIPNDQWSSGLAALNTQQDLAVKSATRILWERQRARMTWPETVTEFAWKAGYRLEIDVPGRENYRQDYENDHRRVWELIRPFNRIDGTGIIDFSQAKMPRHSWLAAPTSDQMWDAQEDLWLLENLFQLITEVNGGSNGTRLDAHIHVIEKLTLHGGQPAGQRTLPSAGGPGGSSGGPAAMMSMPETSGFGGGGGANAGGAGGGLGAVTVPADFDVKEELGDDGSGAAGGAAMSGFGAASALSGGPGGSAAPKAKRYIDDADSLPFKTRGFYMTLIMDHRKIPNLISELSASEKSAWPIEIVRVQCVRLNEDSLDGASSGGFNPGFSSSGGTGFGADALFGGGSSGAGGFTENSFGSGSSSPSFNLEGGGAVGQGGAATSQGAAALAGLMAAVQDPNMSRVAICGVMTIYREVKSDPAAAAPATAPPTAAPAVATPTAGAEATTPAKEAEATTEPATGGEAKPKGENGDKPEAGAEGDAKSPAAPGENANPAEGTAKPGAEAPKAETTPATPDAAKP